MRKAVIGIILIVVAVFALMPTVKASRLDRLFLGTVDIVASGTDWRCNVWPGSGWIFIDSTHYYRYVKYSDWDYFTFIFDYHLIAPGTFDQASATRSLYDNGNHFLGSIRYVTDSYLFGEDETAPWSTVGHGEYHSDMQGNTDNGFYHSQCGPVTFLVFNG